MAPVFERMIKMEAGIDARPKYLVDQVAGIFKHMLMDAVREDLAVGKHVHPRGAEEARNELRRGPGDAGVGGRIFGVPRSGAQRQPRRIGNQAGSASRHAAMLPNEPTLLSLEGMIAANEGDFHKAERMAEEALTYTQILLHTHYLWHNAAGVFAMCGKPEKAVPLLRRCAEMGLPNYLLFGSDRHLNSLHRDADFMALMSGLRVEHEKHCAEFGNAPN